MRVHATCYRAVLDLAKQVIIAWAWFQNDIRMLVARMVDQKIDRITVIDGFGHFAIAAVDGGLVAGFFERVDIIQNVFFKRFEPRLHSRCGEFVADFANARLQNDLCGPAAKRIKRVGNLFFKIAGRKQRLAGFFGDFFKCIFGFGAALFGDFVKRNGLAFFVQGDDHHAFFVFLNIQTAFAGIFAQGVEFFAQLCTRFFRLGLGFGQVGWRVECGCKCLAQVRYQRFHRIGQFAAFTGGKGIRARAIGAGKVVQIYPVLWCWALFHRLF